MSEPGGVPVREPAPQSVADDARLTHVDARGRARMVDVTAKPVSARRAVARCVVRARDVAVRSLADQPDVIPFARAAGVQAAKRTSDLIPLCHPLPLDEIDVRIEPAEPGELAVTATAFVHDRTGVEMEALTACGVAGLTLVMALLPDDAHARLDALTLWHKSGGRSGTWSREHV
jgi:cyclic pyranopterin monophosphate synthase